MGRGVSGALRREQEDGLREPQLAHDARHLGGFGPGGSRNRELVPLQRPLGEHVEQHVAQAAASPRAAGISRRQEPEGIVQDPAQPASSVEIAIAADRDDRSSHPHGLRDLDSDLDDALRPAAATKHLGAVQHEPGLLGALQPHPQHLRPAFRRGPRLASATVIPVSLPGGPLPMCSVQAGPPQRQLPNGREESSETIAPRRSAGCMWVPGCREGRCSRRSVRPSPPARVPRRRGPRCRTAPCAVAAVALQLPTRRRALCDRRDISMKQSPIAKTTF